MTGLPPLARDARLEAAMLSAMDAARLRDTAAACVIDTARSRVAAWRADEDIYPASVVKIALMTAVFARYDDGGLRPDDRVRIASANLTTTAEATPLTAEYEATVERLVELMIERSDNIAANQLIDMLRRERVTDTMRSLGLEHFFLGRKLSGSEPLVLDPEMTGRNSLTPNDAAHLLRLIACDAVPNATAQRAVLSRCVHNDKLVPGLREGDRFAHKTGETSSVSHDAGILQTNDGREYVIVLYTMPPPAPDGSDATHVNPQMAAWMRRLRDAL